MPRIGDNNPPTTIEFAGETTSALSEWLAEHPVISTEDDAREGKLLCDRARDSVADMEAERAKLVGPLRQQVEEINDRYRSPRTVLESTLHLLMMRLNQFTEAEEARRIEEADKKRRALEAAEAAAKEAERLEQESQEAAAAGVLGIDVAATTSQADAAFALYKQAKRESALADRETHVKIGGGFRRALSARNKETLTVDDWREAIDFMGLTDGIRDAILTAARAYRKEFKELPPGVSASHDRSL